MRMQNQIGLKLRLFGTASARLNKVAVVGSGPAGFYTALSLAKNEYTNIDLYEALPVPYGLVRYGVAPDHPEVKNVINRFDKLVGDSWPRVQFIGNVCLGRDVHLSELKQHYDAVVLAYGASHDRMLGLPQESELPNIYSARQLVNWYNGSPLSDIEDDQPFVDLSKHTSCIVVGQGNVAADIGRVLLSPIAKLEQTDIAERALKALKRSNIKHVHLVGRRGPLQASFTSKELRELLRLDSVKIHIDAQLIESEMQRFSEHLAVDRPRKRLLELLLKAASHHNTRDSAAEKHLHLHFLMSPTSFIEAGGAPVGVNFQRNSLVYPSTSSNFDYLRAKPQALVNQYCKLDGSLIVKSVGYLSAPVPGVPWDSTAHRVLNKVGAVYSSESNRPVKGLFVAGWLKRGPTGVIATTMHDAFETAETVGAFLDGQSGTAKDGFAAIAPILRQRQCFPVFFSDWKLVEREEERRGGLVGKPREKMVRLDEILAFVKSKRATLT